MKLRIIFFTVFILFAFSINAQQKTKPSKFGIKPYYGAQLGLFELSGDRLSNETIYGVVKNRIGKTFGLDVEVKKRRWIFGIGYFYFENQKFYKDQGSNYYIDFTLRNIEQGIITYADLKLNNNTKNEIYAGLGHVFSRGEIQDIIVFSEPGNYGGFIESNFPSWEGGIVGKLRWQNNYKEYANFGIELKGQYLYSVDEFYFLSLSPYIKINF